MVLEARLPPVQFNTDVNKAIFIKEVQVWLSALRLGFGSIYSYDSCIYLISNIVIDLQQIAN